MQISALSMNFKNTANLDSNNKYKSTQTFGLSRAPIRPVPQFVLDKEFQNSSHRMNALTRSVVQNTLQKYNELINDASFFKINVDKNKDDIQSLQAKLDPIYQLKYKIEKILDNFDIEAQLGNNSAKFSSGYYTKDEVKCAMKNCNNTGWENKEASVFYKIISNDKHDSLKKQTFYDNVVNLVEDLFGHNAPFITKREISWKTEAAKKVENVKRFISEELTPEKGFADKKTTSRIYKYFFDKDSICVAF